MHTFPDASLSEIIPFFQTFKGLVDGSIEEQNSFSVQAGVISFLADEIEAIDPEQNIETVLQVEGLNVFDGWCEITWAQAKMIGDFFPNSVDPSIVGFATEKYVTDITDNKADLVGGTVPSDQLPSYVDDILEFATLSAFPIVGEVGKIYIDLDTNKQYRWTGSGYAAITNGFIASTNDVPQGEFNLYSTFANIISALRSSPGTSSQVLMADGSVFQKFTKTITSGTQIETTSKTYVIATGLEFTPPAGSYTISLNAHYLSIPGNVVEIATQDLLTLKLYLSNLPATGAHGLSFGSGEILSPGVYTVAGQMSVAGVLTLNGGVNDIFVFRVDGAINTASFTTIQLTGGVIAANVFFIGNGEVGIGANNTISGNYISVGSAVALGADCVFNGRLFSTAGAIAFAAGSISKPTDYSLIPMGILDGFLAYTNGGGITNTALAIIAGNLGAGSAAVVIFTGSVFNGVSFTITQPLGDTNMFAFYQGETQIPFTERTRYFNTYVEDVALVGEATVDGTESISVRWKTDIGRLIFANRIFKLIKD
jgi:hypothetical protein